MKIIAISDLHGFLPQIPECDLLLIAGDIVPDDFTPGTGAKYLSHDEQENWVRTYFTKWLDKVPARSVVGIAGNHDFIFQGTNLGFELPWTYLDDTTANVQGLNIHGAPWTPEFGGWAFMAPEVSLNEKWDKIPEDTDILVVHGPPHGYGDKTEMYLKPGQDPHVGSKTLEAKLYFGSFPNLKLVVFGHIHEGYGTGSMKLLDRNLTWANVSHVDEYYSPNRSPMLFDLDDLART